MYRFKSKATGDLLMLGPQGDRVLQLLGREPAAKGIIEAPAMPAAIVALQAAAEEDARLRAQRAEETGSQGDDVPLRQRVWPFIEMLRLAQAADEPVVWGV